MKVISAKRFTIFVFLTLIMLLVVTAAHAQTGGELAPPEIPGEAVYIPFTVDITLDGELSDWANVPTVTVDKGSMTSDDPAENGSFTFAVAADEENLYITMSMPDQNIVAGEHGTDFWNEDSFEFYVNASGDFGASDYTDEIFQVNVNATNIGSTDPDELIVTGVNSADRGIRGLAFETADGWGIEVAVPLTGLLEPEHGLEIGFQAQINGASKKDRDVKLIWSNADTGDISWTNPAVFGRGIFFEIGQTEIPLPSEPATEEPGEAIETADLLTNGDFSSGQEEWWTTDNVEIDTTGGELCATITDGGTNQWDVVMGQNGIPVTEDQNYTLTFDAYASEEVMINARVQQEASPYTIYFAQNVDLTTATQSYEYTFTASGSDEAASFQFQMGGQGTPKVCVDNVMLLGPKASAEPTPTPIPSTLIYANQVGYLPNAPKRAAVVNASDEPLTWELLDQSGSVVLSGSTNVYGDDKASGDHVHIADFSGYTTPGTDYTLQVDDTVSYPFDISLDVYRQLKYDALAYFYQTRSGIEIVMPYAGDPQWEHPAGHVGVSPNQGDTDVTCFSGEDNQGQEWSGCDYSLDVSGGWYDAGDHGKYVVNGGISVWTLLNQYERALHLGTSADDFANGTMNIPENDNDVPDILDEARWEMAFLLKMQIPESTGDPMAGMAHHKVHDSNWTGIPTAPDQDAQPRYLYPPTTAATLNLAATAAQCARIWQNIDEEFSGQCLTAAKLAWEAAQAHPEEYASDFNGGGSYGDNNVEDEFYWAAAELYLTTGEAGYQEYLTGSMYFKDIQTSDGTSMGWQSTAALGNISLAVVPNDLGSEANEEIQKNIAAAADAYVDMLNGEGYLVPLASSDYWWGSNSAVLNNMIIIALAHDFTGDATYLNAVSEGMDYILGRNAMGQSYVTGYGEIPMQNPHHRFWAFQADPDYPPPPPGIVSGGPNASLEDPYAQQHLEGCAPQKCFVDHIESYSTNEITINWNAPLAWLAAFLDENADWTAEAEESTAAAPTVEPTPAAGTGAPSMGWLPYAAIALIILIGGVVLWRWLKRGAKPA
ncbi:MAG: glycoside hydrolase family 9 protein [Anaerolineae bacterium]|nr:glycoside hydrolase family 9 protein [Anaerolineae bacterium]